MESVPVQNSNCKSGAAWYRRPDFWFYFIIVAGLLFRAEYLREFAAFDHFNCVVGADVQDYYNRACGILNGEIFPAKPDIHAPLYGFFLAGVFKIFGTVPGWARVIQLLLNWGAWIFLSCLLRKRGASQKESLIFLALAMFTPVLIFHQAELISESLLIIIFALCAGCLTKAEKDNSLRWMLCAGVTAGLGVLAHGFMWAFAAVETLYILWQRKWKFAGVFFCGIMLMVLPVILVKSVYYEKFTPLQKNSVFNIWLGHSPNANGGCWLRPDESWAKEHRETAHEAVQRGVSVERIYIERMINFYKDNPAAISKLIFKKAMMIIMPVESAAGADTPAMIYKTDFQYHLRFVAVLIGFFAISGLVLLEIRPPQSYRPYIHFLILTFSLVLAQLASVTSGRYRVPMMPGVLLLAAMAIAALSRKQIFAAVAGSVLLAGLTPGVPRIDSEEQAIMGEVYYRKGKFDQAEKALKYASMHIDHPTLFGNLRGIIAEKRGDLKRAEEFYLSAIRDYDPEANFNLGLMWSKNFPERRNEATHLLIEGLRLDPNRPDVLNQVGVNAVHLGRWQVAEEAFAAAVKLAPEHSGYRGNLEFVRKQRINR